MSIESRAITSARERLKNMEENLRRCTGNEESRRKKERAVEVARFTLEVLEQNRWRAAEEVPPKNDTYLVTMREGLGVGDDEVYTCLMDYEEGEWDEVGYVTAWKPLPEPYEGGTK